MRYRHHDIVGELNVARSRTNGRSPDMSPQQIAEPSVERRVGTTPWHALTANDAVDELHSDLALGLGDAEASQRLVSSGRNEVVVEAPPSRWRLALRQLAEPMNLMLIAVCIVSVFIGEGSTAAVVLGLVVLNLTLATTQEIKARDSMEALADLQVRSAVVVRSGQRKQIDAAEVVPGDIVLVEAGDVVPADGRLLESATLEVQEAALTGESAPVAKSDEPVVADAAVADRASMLFQNTSVTRGTGRMVVTATGMATEVGRIAGLLSGVTSARSPLQRQLDDLTRKIAVVAWGTLAVILVVGLGRGLQFEELMLLGISMAISAIPTGMPTFVQSMLAMGARRLADEKAIVRTLQDVETLGATSRINTDKTGTLTLNQMTARTLYYEGRWFIVDGQGYSNSGAVRGVAGSQPVSFDALAYVAALDTDAVVADGSVVGDPTEAALVVLAEKLGVAVAETRDAYPRLATIPFDSSYKFMATLHRLPYEGEQRIVALVKGAPDVILDRCGGAMWLDGRVDLHEVRDEIDGANAEVAGRGLRVLALAARVVPDQDVDRALEDPMAFASGLTFLGLVGIVDPLRPEAIAAVKAAHEAGIEVRMITGDHLVTAGAIGTELGLPSGGLTGADMAAMSDSELARQLDDVHVFGRVAPEDKLRLVRLLQQDGQVVAMTGDAVNDAAALKQADIGVAMGSGSDVTKQAARMILTDDNFATLVKAVALGRNIFGRIEAYIGYQLTQLFGMVLMFLAATVFGVNDGVALLPLQVLFLNFTLAVLPVVVISLEPDDPAAMRRAPRDPHQRIFNRSTATRWVGLGGLLAAAALGPVAFGPGEPAIDGASVPVTMGFAVMGMATAFASLVMRNPTAPSWRSPLLRPAVATAIGLLVIVVMTEASVAQRWLHTTPLSDGQWLCCLALASGWAATVEIEKGWRRRRSSGRAA
jgi:Ca2+-transporting ATPase